MTNERERALVEEHLAEMLDGEAPAELYDLVAECDEYRDLRHDAGRAVELVRAAGADYVPPPELATRVLGTLEQRRQAVPLTVPTETPMSPPLPAEAPRSAAPARFSLSRRHWLIAGVGLAGGLAVVALAAAAVIALRVAKPSLMPQAGWSGTVESVAAGVGKGLETCNPSGQRCRALSRGQRVGAGSLIQTDAHTRAQLKLADGTELVLDRSTRLVLSGSRAREAKLEAGTLVADVAHDPRRRARFELPVGSLEVIGTKFGLRATGDSASVDVSRGEVSLQDHAGHAVNVRAGEEGRIDAGQPPYATSTVQLGESLAWSDSTVEARDREISTRGLGELRAKQPGEERERENAVSLTSHTVKVRIAGGVARTEVEEVFANHTGEVLEGIYRFPLPPDAQLERLALEVEGKWVEGAFVDRERAAAIWRGAIVNAAPQLKPQLREEIIWVPGPWRDPALLEWQRGGRFELRIYPIPKQGSRRVVLAYTQHLQPTGGVRRYTYPLAYDPSGSTRIADFKLDAEVRGHDQKFGVRARGYEVEHTDGGTGVEKLALARQGFTPSGDLTVEYALPERSSELSAWAFESTGDPRPYLALALRPRLPRAESREQRAYALVVDASRSMFGESYQRATQVAGRIVRELGPEDRFSVLACDSTCRALAGGMREPGPGAAEETRRFLERIVPEGASNVAEAVRSGIGAVSTDRARAGRVIYIGDGTPTVGPIRPALLTRAIETVIARERAMVIALGVGVDSDHDTLRAVARGGGGVVVPYTPGQTTAEAAYAALGASYGRALRDVRVKLPEGLTETAPEMLDTIAAGSESILVARMIRPEVEGQLVLAGKVGDQPFEQRYPLKVVASSAAGNGFVPRLYAATRIADLEQQPDGEAKRQAIELSSAFSVASRYTSLLVLESPAMFKAFGLNNQRTAPEWTGEQAAVGIEAQGELAVAGNDEFSPDQERRKHPSRFGAGLASGAGEASEEKGAGYAFDDAPLPMSEAAPAPPRSQIPAPAAAAPAKRAPVFADSPPDTRRTWIAMRRVWDRVGDVNPLRREPRAASPAAIAEAERDLAQNENRRGAVKKLYTLYALSGDLERARSLAERWSAKEPLDPEALTARADMAARAGDRETAIRILGSVVDVRPGDLKAQQRLARLQRWAGQPVQGCQHSLAIAQLDSRAAGLLAEAVRCARETGLTNAAEDLLGAADGRVRARAERLLKTPSVEPQLLGDLRLEASWSPGADLDLALLDPDGSRISWLGAPTRAVISATSVTSTAGEGLALRGAKPGEYVVEIVRPSDEGRVTGTLKITAANATRSLPFTLDGTRTVLGIVTIRTEPRLVRAW